MEKLAKRMGKLKKGGEAAHETVARMVLNDWQRGRLPYFVAPPAREGEQSPESAEATSSGKTSTDVASTTALL